MSELDETHVAFVGYVIYYQWLHGAVHHVLWFKIRTAFDLSRECLLLRERGNVCEHWNDFLMKFFNKKTSCTHMKS